MNTLRIVASYAIVLTLGLFLSSCQPVLKSSGIVEIAGDPKISVANYADYLVSGPGADGRFPLYLNGPTLMVIFQEETEPNLLYLYLPEDGKQLNVRIDGGMLYVNDKVRAIDLSESEPGSFEAWFASADEEAYRQVRFILFDDTFEPEVKTMLSVNPNMTVIENDEEMTPPAGMITSRPLFLFWVLSSEMSPEEIGQIDFSETRLLFLENDDPEVIETLAKKDIHNLYSLITETGRILSAVPTIRSVSIMNGDMPDAAELGNLEALHVLDDNGTEVLDLDNLPKPGALRVLTVPDIDKVIGLEKLSGLEYLNPGTTEFSSESLASLLSSHPKLRFLDLVHASTETLAPLRQAKSLEVVCLGSIDEGVELDFSPLGGLKHLRYIGVTGDTMEKPEVVAAIQEACPRCSIFVHDGFCLGSGWPALFLPLFLLVLIRKRRDVKTP